MTDFVAASNSPVSSAPDAGSRARRRAGTSRRSFEPPRWMTSLIAPLIVAVISVAVTWGALRAEVSQLKDDQAAQGKKIDDAIQRLARIEGALGVKPPLAGGGAP